MPIARFELPDGRIARFEVPEGTTPEQAQAMIAKMVAGKAPTPPEPALDPSAGGGTLQFGPLDTGIKTPEWLDRGLAGVGKAMTDVGRGVGQMVGAVSRKDVEEARKLDKPLMDTTAGTVGNVLGNVAMLAPTAFIPGVNTVAGGTAVGVLSGLAQPSASADETARNAIFGGVAGGVIPAASRLYRASKSATEPFYEAGQNAILGRALNRAAGRDAPAVAERLKRASMPVVGPTRDGLPRGVAGELVPGSLPTVGQASENAGVAALERAATATNPDVTNAISDIMKAQNAARVGLLDDMAGRDGAKAFFTADRDATAELLYGAARQAGVDPAALTPDVLANIAKFQQRIPDDILAQAQKLAKIKGDPMTDASSIQGMHWVKKAIDDAISSAKQSGNQRFVEAYTGLKNDLLTGMDAMSPDYAVARKVYEQMSRPINQMEVAELLAQKSIDPLTGTLRPSNYARALNDKTAASATGFPGATLDKTMDPSQMYSLRSLLEDVQRSTSANNAGRGAGSDTVQKLAYTNMLDQAGVPSFMRDFAPAQVFGNVLGRGADAAYGRANRELANKLAEVMMNPARAADLISAAPASQRNALLQIMRERVATPAMLSLPATANALQQ